MMINPASTSRATQPGPNRTVVLDELDGVVDGQLDVVAVFGPTAFDVFHLSRSVRESFGSDEEMTECLTTLANETRCEFMKHGLFAGLRPVPRKMEYKVTDYLERKLIRVYAGGRGMLVAVGREEEKRPVIKAAYELLEDGL
ncbi:MAG: hypothetical protein ACQETI_06825 [Halobacteriota archaeon]